MTLASAALAGLQTELAAPRALLRARGLCKVHPDGTAAVRDVDLDLGDGMFGLLGPNGAGKSTLLAMLVLALEPTAGDIRYELADGSERSASRVPDRPAIRSALGFLPQDFRPLAALTGREFLVHCSELRRPDRSRAEHRRRADRWLEAVGLERAGGRRAGAYSGGMQRRLGLAQALIHEPRLLIVDEPTAGLDPEERMRFRNLIAEVAERTAVVLSTHIVEDVEATCPRVAVQWAGRLCFDGAPTALLRRAVGVLWRLPEAAPVPPTAQALGLRADGRGGVERLVRAGERPPGAVEHAPHLEDAYAALLAELGGATALAALDSSAELPSTAAGEAAP